MIKETPARVRAANAEKLHLRLKILERPDFAWGNAGRISAEALSRIKLALVDSRELHYSTRDATHHTCYELRGQETNVWCVGASVQMLLEFYRYEYTQTRIAQESRGSARPATQTDSLALPARVTSLLELIIFASNALSATLYGTAPFTLFQQEIRQNRPVISFIPGHSRTVAGYVAT